MTTEIQKLETKLMSLGLNGLAYSSLWNATAQEINRLKNEEKEA